MKCSMETILVSLEEYETLLARVKHYDELLAAVKAAPDVPMKRDTALVLIAEANRWQEAYEEARDEIERYRRSLVAHHNIANLSEEAIREGYGSPEGCPICREAQT